MKVILFMAMAMNGVIARPNDKEDFLSEYGWTKFVELSSESKCIVWGRRTNEIVYNNYPPELLKDLDRIQRIVVSKSNFNTDDKTCLFVSSPEEAVKKASELGLKSLVLSGGSILNSSFAKLNLIDEIVINIEPVIIGKGIQIFSPEDFEFNMTIESVEKYQGNGLTIVYKVSKSSFLK